MSDVCFFFAEKRLAVDCGAMAGESTTSIVVFRSHLPDEGQRDSFPATL